MTGLDLWGLRGDWVARPWTQTYSGWAKYHEHPKSIPPTQSQQKLHSRNPHISWHLLQSILFVCLHMRWFTGPQRRRVDLLQTFGLCDPSRTKAHAVSCFRSCLLRREAMNDVGQWLNRSPHTQDSGSVSSTLCPLVSILTCLWGWATLQITGNSITHCIRQQKPHPTSTNNSSDTRRCALSTCECVLRLHNY